MDITQSTYTSPTVIDDSGLILGRLAKDVAKCILQAMTELDRLADKLHIPEAVREKARAHETQCEQSNRCDGCA